RGGADRDGARARGGEDPGPVAARAEAGGGGSGPDAADRAAHADRAEGQDPPRSRSLARLDRHHPARGGRSADTPHGRRARPRVTRRRPNFGELYITWMYNSHEFAISTPRRAAPPPR